VLERQTVTLTLPSPRSGTGQGEGRQVREKATKTIGR
jgi:hypothetical protein